MREIIEVHAGGMTDGYKLRGIIPGGASTDFLTEEHLDIKMDFASVKAAGSRLGTGNMIILDDKTCPVAFIHNLIKFFPVLTPYCKYLADTFFAATVAILHISTF